MTLGCFISKSLMLAFPPSALENATQGSFLWHVMPASLKSRRLEQCHSMGCRMNGLGKAMTE